MDTAAKIAYDAIDWNKPELADLQNPTDPTASVLAVIKHLRQRSTPTTGWSPDFIRQLREVATPDQVRAAGERVDKGIASQLIGTIHSNPIIQAGALNLILSMTPERSQQIASTVLASSDAWATGPWGATRGAVDLIRVLMSMPEVPDADLIPLFAWLNQQLHAEWEWARGWDETMLGNSGHNWWLHTYMGFWTAGLMFPEFKGFAQFQAFAPDYFEYEAELLIAPDGYTREVSGYHYGTVNHHLHVYELAEANRIYFGPLFAQRLQAMTRTLWQVLASNGDVPRFGDCGNAHAANSTLVPLRVLAAICQDPEAKYVAEALAPDWEPAYTGLLESGGRNVMPDYQRLVPKRPATDSALVDSGQYFMRSDWTRDADYMAIQAGHIGSIVSSHGHTDIFNVELYSHGRPVLIDNCSGPYGTDPSRTWRVGSASHNVLTIDGADQLPMINEWRWSHDCTPFINAWVTSDDYAYFSGAHEAYRHLPEPVSSCRRKLFFLRGKYWIVIDRTTPETQAEHTSDLNFHILGDCKLHDSGQLTTSEPSGNITLLPVEGARGESRIKPCPYPLDGYENPQHLVYSQTGTGGQLFVTIIATWDTTAPELAAELVPVMADNRGLSPWEATGLRITIDGETHVYVDQHMQWNLPWTCDGHSGQRRVYHSAVTS